MLVKRKKGQIQAYIDFQDLNKACLKDDFSVSHMELNKACHKDDFPISFMYGYLGYN